MMAMALGGRTAEELVFEEPTTGAENDIEKVTRIARAMVTEYGMSDLLGPQQLGQRDGEVFLGRELGHQPNYSEEVAAKIDNEVRALIDEAHSRARAVLTHHRATLDRMARELVEKETLDSMDLEEILGPLSVWPPVGTRPGAAAGANAKRRSGKGAAGTPIPAKAEPAPKPVEGAPPGRRRRPLTAPGRAPVGAATRSDSPAALPAPRRRQAKPAADEQAPASTARPRPRPKPGTQQ
jgi:cell division protease FtsH